MVATRENRILESSLLSDHEKKNFSILSTLFIYLAGK